MNPTFTAENVKVAFETRYHFGWYAHGRQAKLGTIATTLDRAFQDVTRRHDYRVLEYDIQPRVVRAILSLTVWQPGFYVGTVGAATTAQVKAYLSNASVGE